jgi:hypothetical protein
MFLNLYFTFGARIIILSLTPFSNLLIQTHSFKFFHLLIEFDEFMSTESHKTKAKLTIFFLFRATLKKVISLSNLEFIKLKVCRWNIYDFLIIW